MSTHWEAVLANARSFLFVPANRPDRFSKAATAGADVVILDLEDAVSSSEKELARQQASAWLADEHAAVVRINAANTQWHLDDLRMLAQYPTAVMLPKAEQLRSLRAVSSATGGLPVIPLVETAAGILALATICRAPLVARVAFGSIDLATQLGVDPDDRDALLHARSALVMASAASGLAPPIDGVTTVISDLRRVADDSRYSRRLGMTAKLCIHPSQIAAVHQSFAPTSEERAWARRIVDATTVATSAIAVDGAMVDLPVIERARRILATPP